MKYFISKDGNVYAFHEDDNTSYYSDMREVSEVEAKNIINEKTKSDDIPDFVSRAQGKAALIHGGLWQGVCDFVNSISDPVEKAVAEVALNDTVTWQRSSPFLNSASQALGLSDEQLDQLFIEASKIEL